MKSWDAQYGRNTYAQHGDDVALLNLFTLLGFDRFSYLDIGAHHPWTISNTALLYEFGNRGMNVEANPNLVSLFVRDRPEDRNLCIGIYPDNSVSEMPFYMVDNWSGRNSFDKNEIESCGLKVEGTILVPVITINELIAKYWAGNWPDLLLTDIEGLDYEVIKSAEFNGRGPIAICSEVRKNMGNNMQMMMLYKGYRLYLRCGENQIYVRNDHFERAF